VLFLFGVAAAGQFEDGIGALQRSDFAVAMRLLRPLAAAGNANAQFNLGWMYANGKGVPQDYKDPSCLAPSSGAPAIEFVYSSQSTDLRVVLLPSPRVAVIYLVVHSTPPSRSALFNCATRRSTIAR
jgi:TPR repeat protein